MKILPISCNQAQFKAKLPKDSLNTIVDSALSHDKQAGIPQLYTLLEQLDKMPGKKAELKSLITNSQSNILGFSSNSSRLNHCQLRIDGVLTEEGNNVFDILYSAVTSAKTKDGRKIAMPKSVFDFLWWQNKEKTIQDVEQLLV